jgi:hypothetical protein
MGKKIKNNEYVKKSDEGEKWQQKVKIKEEKKLRSLRKNRDFFN